MIRTDQQLAPVFAAIEAFHAHGHEPSDGIGANERHGHGGSRGYGINRGSGYGVTGQGSGQGNRRDQRHGPGRTGNDGHAHLTSRTRLPLVRIDKGAVGWPGATLRVAIMSHFVTVSYFSASVMQAHPGPGTGPATVLAAACCSLTMLRARLDRLLRLPHVITGIPAHLVVIMSVGTRPAVR